LQYDTETEQSQDDLISLAELDMGEPSAGKPLVPSERKMAILLVITNREPIILNFISFSLVPLSLASLVLCRIIHN